MSQIIPSGKETNQKTYSIAVDPGFHGFKVVINGMYFFIPRAIVMNDVSLNDVFSGILDTNRDDFICYNTISDNYYVGAVAYDSSQSVNQVAKSNSTDNMYIKPEFFLTKEFNIALQTVIGYAIYRYNKEVLNMPYNVHNEVNIDVQDNIELILALPHSYCDQYGPVISQAQAKSHEFMLITGKQQINANISYTILPNKVSVISQTVAAVLCKILSDDSSIAELEKVLPTVIIDGGYLTTGLLSLDTALKANYLTDESNLHFTTNTINLAVEKDILTTTGRRDITSYGVDKFIRNEPKIRYRSEESKKTEIYDIEQKKKDIIDDMSKEFIEYLDNKYSNLVAYKSIHIAGGTGILFAEYLKNYYVDETSTFDNDQVIMVQGKNYNPSNDIHKIDPDKKTITVGYTIDDDYSASFGVAIGAYRVLKSEAAE